MLDVIEMIESIQRHVPDQATFDGSEPLQSHVLLNLQRIGECANRISTATRDRFPHVPWSRAVALRNRLAHDYWGTDLVQIWETVSVHLPRLLDDTREISRDLGAHDHG